MMTTLLVIGCLAALACAGLLFALVRRLAAMDLESERKADAICRAVDRLSEPLDALVQLEQGKQQQRMDGRELIRERLKARLAQAQAAKAKA